MAVLYDVWLSPTEDGDDTVLHVVSAATIEAASSILLQSGGFLRLVACMESPHVPQENSR